jgi:hypothetical protein
MLTCAVSFMLIVLILINIWEKTFLLCSIPFFLLGIIFIGIAYSINLSYDNAIIISG